MYYFIRWKHTEEGYVPDIPEDVSFVMLAEPGGASHDAGFALFKCRLPDEYEGSRSVNPVSDELAKLLGSAENYPPALALAQKDLERDESRSEIEFSRKLMERLVFYLDQQIHSSFFLAKARKGQTGYKQAGGYYWIVGYKDKSVLWVSRDYHVYQDPLDDFELDANEIERRFPRG
jgi:hypothetical protein